MTPEQQRKMLECAAKACGLRHVDYSGMDYDGSGGLVLVNENGCHTRAWNPRAIALDTAEMCAKLNIDWLNKRDWVLCRTTTSHGYVVKTDAQKIENHDNSRLKAWMYAATMVAAKIEGYEE